MAIERLKVLQQFYQEDPSDPFNLYALAMEYLKVDRDQARECFELLLGKHKEYLPTYYHAAKFFQEEGRNARAITVYEEGISLARKLNDQKALRELQSAYDELMFE